MHIHTQPSHLSLLSTTHEEVYVPLLPNPPPKRTCKCAWTCLSVRQTERERWASWGADQQGRNSFLWSDTWQQPESTYSTGHTQGCRWLGCSAVGEAGAHTPHSVPLPYGAPPEFTGQPGFACLWPIPTKRRLLTDSDFIWKGIRPHFKTVYGDFSDGTMNKNLPASAGDTGLIPDPGRSPMPRNS